MADDADSKSVGGNTVWVQVPPPAPRRNGLCSIQKAQPFGWAFLIPLRHSSFSPQNFAVQTFVGAPPYGLRKGVGVNFITQTHVKSYILRNQSVAFFLCFHIVKIPPCYTSGMEEFLWCRKWVLFLIRKKNCGLQLTVESARSIGNVLM